jgi:hypothetical protein
LESTKARLLELFGKFKEGGISCGELWELITGFEKACRMLGKIKEGLERGSEEWRRLDSLLFASTYWLNILIIHYFPCVLKEQEEWLRQQLCTGYTDDGWGE